MAAEDKCKLDDWKESGMREAMYLFCIGEASHVSLRGTLCFHDFVISVNCECRGRHLHTYFCWKCE